jgi:hypothetical protein
MNPKAQMRSSFGHPGGTAASFGGVSGSFWQSSRPRVAAISTSAQYARAYHEVRVAAEDCRSGEKPDQTRSIEGVPGGVHQNSHEDAVSRVIDHPNDNQTQTHESEGEHREVKDGSSRGYVA